MGFSFQIYDGKDGRIADVPVGATFIFNNREYIKLRDYSDSNALVITRDPVFSFSTKYQQDNHSLYYRISTKLKNIIKPTAIKMAWAPNEEDYAYYSHLFKDHFHDEWFVHFDDDNSGQDIDGEYIYADAAGMLQRDNADPSYSKNAMRNLSVRTMCLIDQTANVIFNPIVNNAGASNNRARFTGFTSKFWGM